MPAKDQYHDCVKLALIKDGWTITHDPYVISVGRGKAYVDLGAELTLAAEKQEQRIAVEVKSFRGESDLTDFQRAIGQYIFYRSLIDCEEPERKLFLAVPIDAYENVFQERITQPVLTELSMPIIVFRPNGEDIERWIL